ncbi:MAG: 23S rRNA (guanosine(2251)-2'-O)-methyltransferase RlmB [Actinomycetota bacterium]
MRIEGRNPVREALRAHRFVRRIMVASGTQEKGSIEEILELARLSHVKVEYVPRHELDQHAESRSHQGVAAELDDFEYAPWQDAVDAAIARGEAPLVLALDGITDPQNTGSLIRSASVLGAHAVLLPARRAAPVTASVVKASAGAIWSIPVDQVTNLERTLADCKKRGLWVIGLDGDADTLISGCAVLSEPCAIVVGAEGKGMSRLLKDRSDVLVKIAQRGTIDSLGAAAAGAIALFEAAKSRSVFAVGTQLSHSEGRSNPT